jgi:hypothetical protein
VERPFTVSLRVIPNSPVDRAQTRLIAAWRATTRLSVALEWNPGEDELLPNFNYAISMPGEHVTGVGLIAGTSSDRIGTPDGRSWFLTAPFSPPEGFPLPVNGYLGAAYGTHADDLRAVAGLTWWFGNETSLAVQHDGEQIHWIASRNLGELGPSHASWAVDLLLVEFDGMHTLGATLSSRF